MKIKNILAVALISGFALTGCDYNDDNFEGLDEKVALKDVQALEYTLTADDYATMVSKASNMSSDSNVAAALKAIGTAQAFSDQYPASDYIPYFLGYTGGRFYTLSNDSSVKVTYNNSIDAPAILTSLAAASDYTLSTSDYQTIWGSETDFISAVTPATASKLTKVIPTEDLQAGDYVAVTYNYAATEPSFDGPEAPAFKKVAEFAGAGEYLLVAIGDANVAMTSLAADKTYGYPGKTEVTITNDTISAAEADGLTWTLEALETEGQYALKDIYDRYYYQTGTYNSFNISTSLGTDGYAFTLTANEDGGGYTIMNVSVSKWLQYAPAYSSFGSYNYTVDNGVCPTLFAQESTSTASVKATTPTSEKCYAFYLWNGTTFTAADATVLQHSDYTAMGQSYDNLTSPDNYLPAYLKASYPYAQADDVKNVVYKLYANAVTVWAADQYTFDGAAWNKNENIEVVTDQFVRQNNAWVYNPSVVLNLIPAKTCALSLEYYQAATDWVWENVDVPMGYTTKGQGFVTSYANNEYYTGCSAYYGNIDIRPGSARSQCSVESYQGAELVAAGVAFPGDGYGDLSDTDVADLMIKRMQYVLGKVLSIKNPDARPIDGIDVTYTLNVGIYTGSTISECNYAIVYKVVGPAEFEFVEMTEL